GHFSSEKGGRPRSPDGLRRQPHRQTYLPQPIHDPSQPAVLEAPGDSCGFCKEGTFCVCAEAAAQQPALEIASAVHPPAPPPPSPSLGPRTHTQPPPPDAIPHPMEVTSTGAIKLPGPKRPGSTRRGSVGVGPSPPSSGAPAGCGDGGPGSCAQCRAD